jgi:hypothetical protein
VQERTGARHGEADGRKGEKFSFPEADVGVPQREDKGGDRGDDDEQARPAQEQQAQTPPPGR